MTDRIKKLRKALDLTQQEFADRLNVGRNNIAGYETGRRSPSDAVVTLICREFNVNEEWLRTGEGDMFLPENRDSEIASFVKRLLNEEPDSFKNRFVSMLSKLTVEEWEFLERKAKELAGEDKKND